MTARSPTRPLRVVGVLAGLAVFAACAGSSGSVRVERPSEPERTRVPGVDWETVGPTEAGLDPEALEALSARAEQARSTCVAVVRGGRLAYERSWPDGPVAPREVYSVSKSVASLLVGIAQDQGELRLDQPAADFVAPWRDTPSASVTVRNLLSNDSGRAWDFATDYLAMAIAAQDKTRFAIELGQAAPPGSVWVYNNSAIQVLDEVLTQATGEEPRDFARRVLFEPLGMADTEMTTDAAGNTRMFMGVQSTCRDLARLGLLVLRSGRWGERQVVSQAYVDEATRRPSTPLNAAYGLLWWLNRSGRQVGAESATGDAATTAAPRDGQLVPGAPEDAFWALGLGDQIVAVVPSEDLVAVRLGPVRTPGPGFGTAVFTLGVLDAVVEPAGVRTG